MRRHARLRTACFLLLGGVTLTVELVDAQGNQVQPQQTGMSSGNASATGPTSAPAPALHVEEFGITDGAPVDRGFVFFDGRYIEAPYAVRRKGLSVFIGDVMVEGPARWPLPGAGPTSEVVDPEVPPAADANTSQFDPAVTEYVGLKLAYLEKHYSRDEIAGRMAEAYRQLPCVRSAVVQDAVNLSVTWSSGNVDRVCLFPPSRGAAWHDKESLLEVYERMRENYEKRLKAGTVFFLFSAGGQTTMSEATSVVALPPVVAILRSGMTREQKFAALQAKGWIDVVPELGPGRLVTDFQASPQLEERLNETIRRYEEEQRKGKEEATSKGG